MMKKQKTILVTGSSGMVGTRLCEKLLAAGEHVIGVDWKKNPWSRAVEKKTIHLDLRDKKAVFTKLPKNPDIIIHLAANARVFNLVKDPTQARDNFETLFHVLEFARQNRIKKFIFTSSREVYGNSRKIVHSENDSYVKNCESPYTASKIAGEALVHSYQQCYGINFLTFRLSNVYGMYDESDRIVPLFIRQCLKEKDLTVFGKNKTLDFTYIDDVVTGIIASMKRFDRVRNEVFNLGSGKGTSLFDLAHKIQKLLNPKVKIHLRTNRTGEVVKYIANISKAKKLLGYGPKTQITEGLRKSIAWYQKKSSE